MKEPSKRPRRETRAEADRELDEAIEEVLSGERPACDHPHLGRGARASTEAVAPPQTRAEGRVTLNRAF